MQVYQHEISSSDRTNDGPGEGLIWLINTEEKGYNNGRQVPFEKRRLLNKFFDAINHSLNVY